MRKYDIVKPTTHEGWLEERKKGIGSSEVGTILGVNPFQTPRELWMQKMGYAPPTEENLIMKLGHLLEPVVATMFMEETGASIIKNTSGDWLAVDREKPFLRVSPDRLFYAKGDKHTEDNKCILECKTTRHTIDPDNIPMYWYCQVQYQMLVTGIHKCAIAWLTNGTTFGYKFFAFDEDFAYNTLEPSLTEFWNKNIIGNEEPPVVNANDVVSKFPKSYETSITASDEIVNNILALKSVNKNLSELKEEKEKLEGIIKMFIGGNEAITGIGADGVEHVLCTWKSPKPSVKFDAKAFEADNPELYKSYCKQVDGSRRFSIK